MLIQLVSFQPPLPSYESCSRANCPDEKFKILMTRLLITPLITTGFSRTTGTWREAKGSRFMMEQKQQAAGDPLTLTQGSRDQAAGWGKADEPSSCPDPQPLCSLSIRFTYQGVEHKLRNPISDIWQVLGKKKKMQNAAPDASQRTGPPVLLFVFSFFFLGCLSTARLYFMPSVCCSSFPRRPPNVSGNELLSSVSAAVIAYKMYNFTVNQI